MTKSEWLKQFNDNREEFIAIIRDYHPSFWYKHSSIIGVNITAPNAEEACVGVRNEIAATVPKESINLESQDVDELTNMGNAAWFGVPEDRELCNNIPGFWKLCDLLSDPPEDE